MKGDVRVRRSFVAAFVLVTVLLMGSMAFRTIDKSNATAEKEEWRAVQAAVISMMVFNRVKLLPNPVTDPTDDMRRFPDAITSPVLKGLGNGDKPGYVLVGHDEVADGKDTPTVNYISAPATTWTYSVTPGGTVIQGLRVP